MFFVLRRENGYISAQLVYLLQLLYQLSGYIFQAGGLCEGGQ